MTHRKYKRLAIGSAAEAKPVNFAAPQQKRAGRDGMLLIFCINPCSMGTALRRRPPKKQSIKNATKIETPKNIKIMANVIPKGCPRNA